MSRKYRANIAEVSRRRGIGRSTIYRVLGGLSPNARPHTLQILQEEGLLSSPSQPLVIPGNVREFGQDMTLREIESLINVVLKPIPQMTQEELQHLFSAKRAYPDVYREKTKG